MSKKRKKSGHFCWACGRNRPNEKFSGKGHKNHLCKECSHESKDTLDEILHTNDIVGFWNQKHISQKNIVRLKLLSKSPIVDVAELAKVVLEVARKFPFKKKRIRRIIREQKDLMPKLAAVGLVFNWMDQEEYDRYREDLDDEYEYEYEFEEDEFEEEASCYEEDDPRDFEYHLYGCGDAS